MNEPQEAGLLPCPNPDCNAKPSKNWTTDTFWIDCDCGWSLDPVALEDEAKLTELWNTRAQSPDSENDWEYFRAITDQKEVLDSLQAFSCDSTEDNSVFVVKAIAAALQQQSPAQGEHGEIVRLLTAAKKNRTNLTDNVRISSVTADEIISALQGQGGGE
jgi:hypothetical protein